MASSDNDDLRTGTHNGHLMVAALKRHRDRPIIHLGDVTLTGQQVADRISTYIQAFESLGAGTGTAGALLALTSPVVVLILGAGHRPGYRRSWLHPLGSSDDPA
jgi:fatty-acyl-CoA synthase